MSHVFIFILKTCFFFSSSVKSWLKLIGLLGSLIVWLLCKRQKNIAEKMAALQRAVVQYFLIQSHRLQVACWVCLQSLNAMAQTHEKDNACLILRYNRSTVLGWLQLLCFYWPNHSNLNPIQNLSTIIYGCIRRGHTESQTVQESTISFWGNGG